MHTSDRSSPAQSFSALALEHDDCFAVRQAARHLSQLYERHLSAAGLTPTQFSLLGALGALGATDPADPADPAQGQPSLTMAQLARTMVMERTTLVRALRPLLRSGLVADLAVAKHSATDGEHAPQGADCRRRQVALTAAGRARLDEAGVHWRAAQDEFERRFGAQRAAWLRRELLRITRAV